MVASITSILLTEGRRRRIGGLLCWLLVAACGAAAHAEGKRRDFVRIVGDREVYPLISVVVEWFGESTFHKYPLIEATGADAGFGLFCRGAGVRTPDMLMLERRLSPQEYAHCMGNGVDAVVALLIGHRIRESADGGQRTLPVYLYLKRDHLALIPGLWAFTEELVAPHTIGRGGYLKLLGLVPLAPAARQRLARQVAHMAVMVFPGLPGSTGLR